MAVQTFSTFSNNAQDYIAAKTLMRINRDVIVHGLGSKHKLPNNFSKTFQFTRFEKLNLPQTALSEGVTPSSGSSMSINRVQAVMDQWGDFVNLSDVSQITSKHPVLQEAIKLLSEQAVETIDRECIKVLLANTNVYYGNGGASRVATTAGGGDYLLAADIKKVCAFLRNGGAHPMSNRTYKGLIDPSVEMDIISEAAFLNAAQYSNLQALMNAEVGQWFGVRFVVSNLIPTLTGLAAAAAPAHTTVGGTFLNVAYDCAFGYVDDALGFETQVTQDVAVTPDANDKLTFTCPATAGYTYNIYIESVTGTGTLYLASSGNAPSASVDIDGPPAGTEPLLQARPATGEVIHFSWVMGEEAFAVPELQSLQAFLTPDQPSDSDPLRQRRKAAWKVMFKAVIQNEAYIARIESASAY